MESKLGKLSRTNSKAFEDAARALECDESEGRFDAALKKIAAHKPPKTTARKGEALSSKK